MWGFECIRGNAFIHLFNLKLLPSRRARLFRFSLNFYSLSIQDLQRATEQKCVNEDQICQHLDVDAMTYAAQSASDSYTWAADRESSCLWRTDSFIIYLQLLYVAPITRTKCLQQHSDRRVIASLDSCVGVKFPCSSRLHQIVKNDFKAGNRFPPGEERNVQIIKCIQHTGAAQVSTQPLGIATHLIHIYFECHWGHIRFFHCESISGVTTNARVCVIFAPRERQHSPTPSHFSGGSPQLLSPTAT